MRPIYIYAACAAVAAADKASFDCPMRGLAVEFAAFANPYLTAAHLQDVADALNASPEKTKGCNVTVPASLLAERSAPRFRSFPLRVGAPQFFVDYASGSDSAAGTQAAPFKTVAHGLAASRAAGGGGSLVLRAGTHFMSDAATLDARDSGLAIQAFPGEEAWLSRGVPLAGLSWQPFNTSAGPSWSVFNDSNAVYGSDGSWPSVFSGFTTPDAPSCQAKCDANFSAGGACSIYTWHDANQAGFANQCWFRLDGVWSPTPQSGHVSGFRTTSPNIWVADVSSFAASLPSGISGLRAPDGTRLIRARYPNANPEFGFGSTLSADSWTRPPWPIAPAVQVEPQTPNRTSSYSFIHYQGGIGGVCAQPGFGFTETNGSMYWCGSKTEGGGAFTWRTPVGMTTSKNTLPNLPYKNTQDAIVQAWHPARWASRMYRLDAGAIAFDSATGQANISFAEGGYQDARGSDNAGNWYIENVFEELDAPSEWYFDAPAQKLYLFWNATSGTPPPSDSIVAVPAGAQAIVNVTGTQGAPVTGLAFLGVGFRDAADVFFAVRQMEENPSF